ncbi:uncharacterized protein LOC119005785 isoform X16 [Acanthopagrus latus]|uniref:uncharacterized protein LOC119005785 isoform X16 n=1 Tax=Acanthopagrus latus TaxID=8177 RepID=UPI00187CBB40|nr:uncharacterized protein LOC119005785 isoform X16 [Acanthopagrus latus]
MAEAAGAGVDTKPEAEHFVDKHQSELIKRVSNVGPILDELLCRNVIQQESYDEIKTLPTAEEKMRELISGPLKSIPGKYIFYQILIENEPFLVEDLKRMDAEVVTVGTIKELLLKTLTDLSYEERQNFKWFLQFTLFQRSLPQIPWSRLLEEDMAESLVDVMVEKCGQKSLEVIREVLMDMNWTDLVQRLSEGLEAAAGSSGEVFGVNTTEKEKYYVEEDRPALIQKVSDITSVCEVESMESVIELLVETLKDLSVAELKEFIGALLSQPEFHRPFLSIPLKLLQTAHMQDTVFFMVQIRGQKCVKKTEDILKTMKRTDLVQRLSERGSESKKKHSADEHRSALIHKVATIAAVQQLLLEILNDLSKKQLKKFKNILQSTVSQKNLPDISWMFNYRADIVNQMVHTYGQQSVELTREVLMDMKRTDLLQMLSKPSSGLKEKHRPSLIQRVETMESVIELLLKALKDFTKAELKTFKSTLHPIYHEGHSSVRSMQQKAKYIPLLDIADMQGTVCLMVQYYGQQSVEVTKESLKKMKRTNLVQRLSDSSSRPKKKFRSAQIKKAAMMGAVKELLLETLNDLSYEEQKNLKWFLQFTLFQRSLPQIPWSRLQKEDMTESLVDVMVEIYGQKSVQVIREVLIGMNRTDLVQRLSETNSGLEAAAGSSTEVFGMNTTEKEKHSVEEDRPVLIEKVETMESVIELLLETLKDLSEAELKMFKWNLHPIYAHAASSVESVQQETKCIPFDLLNIADMQGTMCLMVQYCGQQSVERAKEILKEMRRTDLVQRLSDSSSRPKTPFILSFPSEKLSVDELQSVLINKAATMRAVKELLLETLNDLSYEEQKNFAWFLQFTCFQRSLPQIPWSRLQMSYMAESLVDVMVEKYGQKSVEVTREVLMDMNRTDLVQRLSETSSELKVVINCVAAGAGSSAEVFGVNTTEKEKHSVEEDWPALIQKVESMESVIELLLETLKILSDAELEEFKRTLFVQIHIIYFLSSTIMLQRRTTHVLDTVFIMVLNYGEQSVEKTKYILMTMKRTDLVQRLSDRGSESKKKHAADEHHSALIHKVATEAAVQQLLLETLNDLSKKQLKKFKNILQSTVSQKNLPDISWMFNYRADIVNQMVHTYGQQSVELTREVLMVMKKTVLVQKLSKPSSGLKGPSRGLEHEDIGSAMDSSDWTKLEPEVNCTDADEAPTYSLQSEAGNFECSVSCLRWVCKEKVSFKYQFCSWEEPMERMKSMKYMLAGPLIDITVNAGKLDEVFLPHWICIDDNPEIRDKFAVLHIDDCGDVVEKVAEVTSSHVKLSEPVFSPRAVLMKVGVPVRINCKVLIYKTNTAFLTLHVYLIPCDPGLQQELNRRQFSSGYRAIQKPHPEKSLKMRDRFILTADLDGAEIYPEKLKLRYESRDPNFFEVYVENPDRKFTLKLTKENEHQPVWTCALRKDEYQSSALIQVEHFVDKHQCDLIARVSNTGPILDNLLREGVIQQEDYDTIRTITTTQERMRKLFSGPLKAGGQAAKDVFFRILKKEESYLVADLNRKES